jgi:hypothetical protein
MDFKNLKKKNPEPKGSAFCQLWGFPKENHTLRYGLKNFIENLYPGLWILILCDFHLRRIKIEGEG